MDHLLTNTVSGLRVSLLASVLRLPACKLHQQLLPDSWFQNWLLFLYYSMYRKLGYMELHIQGKGQIIQRDKDFSRKPRQCDVLGYKAMR